MWPALWTLLLPMVGTLPHPQHHHPHLRESARWLLLVSAQTLPGFFTQPFPGLQAQSAQREPLRGAQSLPTGSLAGRWCHGWLEPNNGRTQGFTTWDLPQAAAVGGLLGVALTLPPVLLADTGLLDSHVSRCLCPAFGLTAFDPWPCGKCPRPPVSL